MTKQHHDQLLSDAVIAVLETMFFAEATPAPEAEATTAFIKARVAFHGRPSGILTVSLSAATARVLATGFLGEDEECLDDAQPGEIVCELANMLCGSLLSQMESKEIFDLASPQLVLAGSLCAESELRPAASQSFAIDDGILTAILYLEAAA